MATPKATKAPRATFFIKSLAETLCRSRVLILTFNRLLRGRCRRLFMDNAHRVHYRMWIFKIFSTRCSAKSPQKRRKIEKPDAKPQRREGKARRMLGHRSRRIASLCDPMYPLRLSVTCRPLRLPLAFFAPEILKPLNLFRSENRRQLSQFLPGYISLPPTGIPPTEIPFPSSAPVLLFLVVR